MDAPREPIPEARQGVNLEPRRAYATMVFDVLYARGRDLPARPLSARRAALERLVEGSSELLPVRRLASDGRPGKERGEQGGGLLHLPLQDWSRARAGSAA
jgi:hypothetical protein